MTPRMPVPRSRSAVIGSGVAGRVAAYVLSADHDVTLYEADDRLGGHADTHDVDVDGRTIAVDTGFIVHNARTYPTLLRLFDDLGVQTQESEMSMSVRDDARGLEYAGALGLSGLFPSRANLRDRDYLKMLVEVPRFHRAARRVLAATAEGKHPAHDVDGPEQTVGDFVVAQGFSAYFQDEFLVPMIAAVWSCEPARALDYPARYLFTFLEHHGMLGVLGSPTWRTVTGGSREYVRRVAKNLADVRTSSPVTSVRETSDGVEVTSLGRTETYAGVVIATHPDQALAMLAEPTHLHRELLGAIPYSRNVAQLHTDERLLPRNTRARASWNFQHRADRSQPVLVTYDLTRLQRLDSGDERMLVTLGGSDVVDPATVIATMDYAHPTYTPTSVAARSRRSPAMS
jgi:predicted NAD/FAD-binding protein